MAHKVSLFVPCFVDQLLPKVALDTVTVLRRIGFLDVEVNVEPVRFLTINAENL